MTRDRFTRHLHVAHVSHLGLSALVLLTALAGFACRTNTTGIVNNLDGGRTDGPRDMSQTEVPANCERNLIDKKSNGQACACADECRSGICAQGVCCSTTCDGVCKSCNLKSGPGVCGVVPAGEKPFDEGQCKAENPATCGLDGTCDGAGACRKYPDGFICQAGSCMGAAVVGAKVCSGGSCQAGPSVSCSPYGCNAATGRCHDRCDSATQCDSRDCKSGSCGLKPLGAICVSGAECASKNCAQGVCCNLACTGPCVACNQVGRMGECDAVPVGIMDPNGHCKVEGKDTCGTSGLCNGLGGCAKYAAGTECRAASCSGGSERPAAVCDGEGQCQAGTDLPCAPYQCTGGSCKATCTTNDDCVAGNVCTAGSCGKKPNGQTCTVATDCQSGFCVDGFCCNNACTGTCVSCGLSNQRGRCTNVPSGTPDPRGTCRDMGAGACKTNGRCDGNKGCQNYPTGTVCKAASCNTNTNAFTQASTCQGGTCRTPTANSCSPFKCNGSTSCGTSCASNNDCIAPNTCVNGSCGKKPLGQVCSNANECQSNFCADGVCCENACAGSCFSCKLSGQAGRCLPTEVGSNDPKGMCTDQGLASCGTDGKCDGAGACRKYSAGAICKAASCASGMATAASTCDGLGACKAGATTTCSPYVCNTTGTACFNSCTDNTACASPNVCNMNSCGKKGLGVACMAGTECDSGNCVEGVCCNEACTGTCKSCTVTNAVGTCSNIPANAAAPMGQCTATDPSSCGNDGKCNGMGACQKWGTDNVCRMKSCPMNASTQVQEGRCTGAGACAAEMTTSCGAFKCDPGSNNCRTSCDTTADCSGSNVCIGNQCVMPKANGAACGGNAECSSGQCVGSICCATACPNEPGNSCGNTGACLANGSACEKTAAGTMCAPTCGNGDLTSQPRACNGSGACASSGAPTVCLALCDPGTGLCRANCTGDNQCPPGKICMNPGSSGMCVDPPPPDGGSM